MDSEWVSKWDKYLHWKKNKQIGLKKRTEQGKELIWNFGFTARGFVLPRTVLHLKVLSHSVGWSDIESEVSAVCPVSVETTRYRVHGVCMLFNAQVDSRGDTSDLRLEVVRLESRSGRWLIPWMLIVAFRSVCRETEPKYEYRFVQRSAWLLTKVFI
jgi:hypothetical protein